MNRAPYRSWLLGLALLSLFFSKPVLATSPTFAIFYGGNLRGRVLVNFVPDDNGGFAWDSRFLWDTSGRGGTSCQNGALQRGVIPNGLSGRPYVKFAIFWGAVDPNQAKPEQASQHGRLYLPRMSEPAVVVSTPPFLGESEDSCLRNRALGPFGARPIPEDLGGFVAGWVLTTEDIVTAMHLGIPGL
jgi:hypothetical protein